MKTTPFNKTGLETLLTPENSALILIDHQPFQFASINSHDPQTIINNVVGLAKVAKLFKVPTLLTTVTEAHQSHVYQRLGGQADRRLGGEDRKEEAHRGRSVDGNLPRLPRDPCARGRLRGLLRRRRVGRVTSEAHEMGIQRMIQAGTVPLTWGVLSAEWQRDWAREATVSGLAQIVGERYGATGTSFLWEQQLLNQGGSNRR